MREEDEVMDVAIAWKNKTSFASLKTTTNFNMNPVVCDNSASKQQQEQQQQQQQQQHKIEEEDDEKLNEKLAATSCALAQSHRSPSVGAGGQPLLPTP